MTPSSMYRAGYVALVGEPNVGKSTLMNALLGQKLSIVTKKPQTTRQRVLGIWSDPESQMIFLDTPGLLEPRYLLHEKMIQVALRAVQDADILLVMTEPSRGTRFPRPVEKHLFSGSTDKPVLLCINKADTVVRDTLLPLIGTFAAMKRFAEIVPISALKDENIDALRVVIKKYLPVHPAYYPEDAVSEQPERFFVAELLRETIFEEFKEEIPYSTAVEIREFKEREDRKTYINADIVVERSSQKGILIGKRGEALKSIGQSARARIEEFLGRPVYLELHVKVGEHWRAKESWMKRLGYTIEGADSH